MTDLKELLVYKYAFGSLYYEPESRGAEATVRLVATGEFSQPPMDRTISFYSGTLQDEPQRHVRRENKALLDQIGKCRLGTAWVRFYDGGLVDFQVLIVPEKGEQRFYVRSSLQLSDEQREAVENQIKRAFRPC